MWVGISERRKTVDQGHEQGRPGRNEQRKRKEGKEPEEHRGKRIRDSDTEEEDRMDV
jgi:hypothetical protein